MEASGITSIKCFKKYCALKTVYLAKLSFNNGGENNNLYKKQEHEEFTKRPFLKKIIKDLVQEVEK